MNVTAYRRPDSALEIFQTGEAEPLDLDKSSNGFCVAPFDPLSKQTFYKFERELEKIPEDIILQNHSGLKFDYFSQENYKNYIGSLLEEIGGSEDRKIVASRRKEVLFDRPDITNFLRTLCQKYPNSYVFFISTKETGTWIGASPELLLEKRGNELNTMALAGTRAAGTQEPWDIKNTREQRLVTEYIVKVLSRYCENIEKSAPTTQRVGSIEHIMTKIKGKINKGADLNELLKSLSPTPALCGVPRDLALEAIKKFEGERYLYGGYCGPVDEEGNFLFNVILRCAYLLPGNRSILFAGGGITSDSDPQLEWEETEKKMQTLLGAGVIESQQERK